MSEEISPRRSMQMTWFFVAVVGSAAFVWCGTQFALNANIAYLPGMAMGGVGIFVGGLMMRAYELKGGEES